MMMYTLQLPNDFLIEESIMVCKHHNIYLTLPIDESMVIYPYCNYETAFSTDEHMMMIYTYRNFEMTSTIDKHVMIHTYRNF